MAHIIVDIETVGHECSAEFIERPDLDAIQPAGNLKDPAKVAESIEKRRQEALAEYERALSRCALDWNLSRIVAVGWHLSTQSEPVCELARTEDEERALLERFWQVKRDAWIVGFNARGYDVPTLLRRSQLLGVSAPKLSLARYGRGSVIDVRDELTFDDARYEAIMPRTLKAFAKRFGIPCADEATGKDVASLVASGDWEGVRSHCLSDVDLTRELALRIGLVSNWARVA